MPLTPEQAKACGDWFLANGLKYHGETGEIVQDSAGEMAQSITVEQFFDSPDLVLAGYANKMRNRKGGEVSFIRNGGRLVALCGTGLTSLDDVNKLLDALTALTGVAGGSQNIVSSVGELDSLGIQSNLSREKRKEAFENLWRKDPGRIKEWFAKTSPHFQGKLKEIFNNKFRSEFVMATQNMARSSGVKDHVRSLKSPWGAAEEPRKHSRAGLAGCELTM